MTIISIICAARRTSPIPWFIVYSSAPLWQKSFFDNAAVTLVPWCFASVPSVTEANAIAAQRVANSHGDSRSVQPIAATREPNVVGRRTGYGSETIGCAGPAFA